MPKNAKNPRKKKPTLKEIESNIKWIRILADEEEAKLKKYVQELRHAVDNFGAKSPFMTSIIRNIDNSYHNYQAIIKILSQVEEKH